MRPLLFRRLLKWNFEIISTNAAAHIHRDLGQILLQKQAQHSQSLHNFIEMFSSQTQFSTHSSKAPYNVKSNWIEFASKCRMEFALGKLLKWLFKSGVNGNNNHCQWLWRNHCRCFPRPLPLLPPLPISNVGEIIRSDVPNRPRWNRIKRRRGKKETPPGNFNWTTYILFWDEMRWTMKMRFHHSGLINRIHGSLHFQTYFSICFISFAVGPEWSRSLNREIPSNIMKDKLMKKKLCSAAMVCTLFRLFSSTRPAKWLGFSLFSFSWKQINSTSETRRRKTMFGEPQANNISRHKESSQLMNSDWRSELTRWTVDGRVDEEGETEMAQDVMQFKKHTEMENTN